MNPTVKRIFKMSVAVSSVLVAFSFESKGIRYTILFFAVMYAVYYYREIRKDLDKCIIENEKETKDDTKT